MEELSNSVVWVIIHLNPRKIICTRLKLKFKTHIALHFSTLLAFSAFFDFLK